MESRNRYLFCETCVDFIYDHGLERLCAPDGKYELEGEALLQLGSFSDGCIIITKSY